MPALEKFMKAVSANIFFSNLIQGWHQSDPEKINNTGLFDCLARRNSCSALSEYCE
jgi:hypothetical protein